jgi:hypothetical protein
MIKTVAQCRVSHPAHGHSAVGHGGPHTSWPTAKAARPARSGSVGRPTAHGAGHRREGTPAWSLRVARRGGVEPAGSLVGEVENVDRGKHRR